MRIKIKYKDLIPGDEIVDHVSQKPWFKVTHTEPAADNDRYIVVLGEPIVKVPGAKKQTSGHRDNFVVVDRL